MTKSIETARLILQTWRDTDAVPLYNICLDYELRRSGVSACVDLDEARNVVASWQGDPDSRAVVRKEDDRLIGFVQLGDMNRYAGYKELEYAIVADCRGKGYATEAVRAMLDFAFSEREVAVVAAWVRSFNRSSVRVLEKCGFVHEGTLRKHARDGSDTLCYSILKEEWIR